MIAVKTSAARVVAAVLVMLSPACSSSSRSTPQAPGSEGGAASDASLDASGPSCPGSAPAQGGPCAPQGLACEYGSAAVQSCDTVATCNGGRWVVAAPAAGAPLCQGGTASQCPASFATVPVGQHCDVYPVDCDYPQGRCACAARTAGPTPIDASAQASWICPSPDATCPLPRPRLGTPCTAKVECDYGSCAIPGATAESCTGGVWTESATACPVER